MQSLKPISNAIANIVFFVLMFALTSVAFAKDAQVQLNASVQPGMARVGERVVVDLQFEIPEGYHLYSITKVPKGPRPLRLTIDAPHLEAEGHWHAPTPHVELDPNFKRNVEFYEGQVHHKKVFVLKSGDPGESKVQIKAKGQICNPKQCIVIVAEAIAPLNIEAGEPRPEHIKTPKLEGEAFGPDRQGPSQDVDTSGEVHSAVSGQKNGSGLPMGDGLLSFIAIAFLAGFAALVTPCVFPMIPITVSFFSKFSKVSMQRSVLMATIYAVSIVATFTLLGVAVSAIFGAVGMQTLSASPIFNIFLSILLVVFAFNLFGLFEIQIPSWLIARTSEKEHELKNDDGSLRQQAAGVFFMALTFTLVSFTCTVGFIGVVLAEAAKGNWFYPAIGMFCFALAFALPFFLLAVFPAWADKLKGKAGDWMVAVKVTLGFLELAGAFKFISNVDLIWQAEMITRPLVLSIWTGLFLGAGLYLLRIFNLPHSDSDSREVGPIRMAFGLGLISLAAFSFSGIRDTKSMGGWIDGWLPPAIYPGQEAQLSGEASEHLAFMVDDIPGAMAKGRAENKPIFIDFTGYTCTNCRYMESSVFPRAEIRSRLEQMVLVTAYTDCDEEVCDAQRKMQLERFETAALPFYAVINPHDDTVLATFADMTNEPKEYQAFLQNGLDAFSQIKSQYSGGDGETHKDSKVSKSKIDLTLQEEGTLVDFEFPSLKDGTPTKLSSFRGDWVFLNFWASWCGPCKEELEHEFPKPLAGAPHIKFITIAFDGNETKAEAVEFSNKIKLFENVVLQGGEDVTESGLSDEFGVDGTLPISYLIHPKGHIAWRSTGALKSADLKQLFAATKTSL